MPTPTTKPGPSRRGIIEAGSVWQAIATILEFFWELSLGVWLTVKGFNPAAAILSEPDKTDLNERDEKTDKLSLAKA